MTKEEAIEIISHAVGEQSIALNLFKFGQFDETSDLYKKFLIAHKMSEALDTKNSLKRTKYISSLPNNSLVDECSYNNGIITIKILGEDFKVRHIKDTVFINGVDLKDTLHKCHETCFNLAMALNKEGIKTYLHTGYIYAYVTNNPMLHSWIELKDENLILDTTYKFAIDKNLYNFLFSPVYYSTVESDKLLYSNVKEGEQLRCFLLSHDQNISKIKGCIK